MLLMTGNILPNADQTSSNFANHSCQKEAEKESPEASEKKIEAKYNRKEKSLGELSKKFLMMFGRLNEDVISLDNVTVELGS